MYSIDELARDFRELGVAAGGTVMLHASVGAVGEIAGGPDAIHLALKSAVTPDGTMIMYASCPRFYDELGRGNLNAHQERDVYQKLPAFDPLTARSDPDNGILVEFLRTFPGSRVNDHVARFVCWGKQAEYLLAGQPWNYAFGGGSALERFALLNGNIIMLGSDPDAVTFIHYVEHIVDIPAKRVARFKCRSRRMVVRYGAKWKNSILQVMELMQIGRIASSPKSLIACWLRPEIMAV